MKELYKFLLPCFDGSFHYRKADTNNSGFLSFDEIKGLCHSLNIKMEKELLKKIFMESNTNHEDKSRKERGQQVLNEDEFVAFYYKLMRREEIDELFAKYSEKVRTRHLIFHIHTLVFPFMLAFKGTTTLNCTIYCSLTE